MRCCTFEPPAAPADLLVSGRSVEGGHSVVEKGDVSSSVFSAGEMLYSVGRVVPVDGDGIERPSLKAAEQRPGGIVKCVGGFSSAARVDFHQLSPYRLCPLRRIISLLYQQEKRGTKNKVSCVLVSMPPMTAALCSRWLEAYCPVESTRGLRQQQMRVRSSRCSAGARFRAASGSFFLVETAPGEFNDHPAQRLLQGADEKVCHIEAGWARGDGAGNACQDLKHAVAAGGFCGTRSESRPSVQRSYAARRRGRYR